MSSNHNKIHHRPNRCRSSEHCNRIRRRRTNRRGLRFEPLEQRCLLAGDLGAALVADLAPGPESSSPLHFTNLADRLYFSTSADSGDTAVWVSDGTAPGTTRLQGNFRYPPQDFAQLGESVYFAGIENGATTPQGVWKTDGTVGGTVRIKETQADHLTTVGDQLFFSMDGELGVSDGTASGTKQLKNIHTGKTSDYCGDRQKGRKSCGSPNVSSPNWLTDLNGTLLFAATDGKNGRELWKSDGTRKGTRLVKDIVSGIGDSNPQDLVVLGDHVYFNSLRGLWKSDGTDSGTVQVTGDRFVRELMPVGNTLFYATRSGIWNSDGTAAGTVLVKNIRPDGGDASIESLTNVNGTLFFTANDAVAGTELWKSDGTAAGTVMVRDIHPGPGGSQITNLAAVNHLVYFAADDGIHGQELWQTDGTVAGTIMQDIYPGEQGSGPGHLTEMGNKLYFAATDPIHGREFWDPPVVEPIDARPAVGLEVALATSGAWIGSSPSPWSRTDSIPNHVGRHPAHESPRGCEEAGIAVDVRILEGHVASFPTRAAASIAHRPVSSSLTPEALDQVWAEEFVDIIDVQLDLLELRLR